MTKDNKIIKDLKERNRKLSYQYRERDIRCFTLERQIKEMKEENQKYKETIDKAIGYLKKWGIESDADMYWRINEYKEYRELLAILKEVE